MTIANGDTVEASDILAINTIATSAQAAAATALANSTTALANSVSAEATAANALSVAGNALAISGLPLATSVSPSNLVPVSQGGTNVAVTLTTFNAGVNASIASVGTVAAGAAATAASAGTTAATALTNAASAMTVAEEALTAAGAGLSIGNLTVVTSVGANDLLPIDQSGTTNAVSTANLLAAETIDLLSAAGSASDTDTFLTGQGTNVLTRQTMAAVWTWLKTHLPGYQLPIQEITRNTTIDGTYNGNILVVTAAGVVISPNYTLMGAGFECEVVTSGSGTVVWGSGVTATNGASGLPVSSYAKLMAFTSSAGNVVLASVGAASGSGVSVPGSISGLTFGSATSTTLAFTWSAPSSGGTATYYQVQYRVTGGSSWSAAPGTAILSETLTGLTPSTEYDVQVAAGNSAGLSAFSATVNGTTAASGIAAPGTPTGLTVGTTTATTVPLSWTAPGSGGAVATYTVQYRVTSVGGAWTQLTGITVTNATVTGLTASTQYDFQVQAANTGGTSAFTATTNGTTAAAASTVAAWNTTSGYPTSIAHGSSGLVYNLYIVSGTTPATVAIGFSTSQSVAPSPMPATADGTAGNFNGNYWGTYMHAPASPGTYYAWGIGYNSGGTVLFTIVGNAITVT